jgi:hypothetical protein
VKGDELSLARERLLFALVLAGLTGDETFGELLDAIDEYAALSVRAALEGRPIGPVAQCEPKSHQGGTTL